MTQTTQANNLKLALIGYGEAGQAFVRGWGPASAAVVCAYDIKTDDPATQPEKQADYERTGIAGASHLAGALRGAELIFSLVTADRAQEVAEAAARHITAGAYYFDCNSCAPGTKRQAATFIEAAGAHYVDVAVMAPVGAKLHQTPLLISGPHTGPAAAILVELEMRAEIAEGEVGTASTIKMIRSIMMKGLEGLFMECVLAGRQAGVDDIVLTSLDNTYPGFDFKQKAAMMMERVMVHGHRRAAEMSEVAITVDELGLSGRMARATVEWQKQIADLGLTPDGRDYTSMADKLLTQIIVQDSTT